jgi:hypothetical protein
LFDPFSFEMTSNFQTFFLFTLLLAAPVSAETLEPDAAWECPAGIDNTFSSHIFKQGVVGSQPLSGKSAYPISCSLRFTRPFTGCGLGCKIKIELAPPLQIENVLLKSAHQTISKPRSGSSVELEGVYEKIEEIEIQIPTPTALKTEQKSSISLSIERSSSPGVPVAFSLPLTIKAPGAGATVYLMVGAMSLLAALLYAAHRFRAFQRFSSSELTAIAVFSAFFAAGNFFGIVLRLFALPNIAIQFFWDFYYFTVVLCCVRVLPRLGALLVSMLGGFILSGLLFFGLNPLTLLTWVMPGALALETWFALTGYGARRLSSLGAAPVFLLVPTMLYWFVVAPFIFRYYYAGWYVTLSLAAAGISYLLPALFAHGFANRLGQIVR